MEFEPHSPRPAHHWGAPDPTTRYGLPLTAAPTPVTPPPHVAHPRRTHRRRTLVAATAACFLLGLSSAAVIVRATSNDPTSAPVTSTATTPPVTAAPRTTVPVTIAPATTAPRATAPPTSTPATSATSEAPQRTSNQIDLDVGLVDIYTVLKYQRAEAAGTGIILSADGRILTNNHVIAGSTEITVVVVASGKEYKATVVGTSPTNDIAVLQLADASGLTPATLGDSSKVQIGDAITAVGNAGGDGGEPTVATGQVTDLGQTITATDETGGNQETLHDLIEISAQLQPGQSGGPLYNAAGEVVGVDSAGSASGRYRVRGNESRGYAIPINDALALVQKIEAGVAGDGITIGTPPLLGVSAQNSAAGETGVSIANVVIGGPAAKMGLAAGDTIVAIDGATIATSDDLTTALHAHQAGDKVKVSWVDASGATKSGTATLIAGPAD